MSNISVVVPIYKVEAFLPRCVDSILRQTYYDFDLILVDDGSPDRCGEICDEYARIDERVHVIHQINQGVSVARNAGIEWALNNSHSEWITFIDSDDWVHEKYLEVLYETALKYNVQLSICDCIKTANTYLQDENTEISVKLYEPEDFWCLRRYNSICTKLYRKNLLRTIRFPAGILYEDVYVTYQLIFAQKSIAYIETPLYYYYLRDGSTTHTKWSPKVLPQLNGYRQQLSFLSKERYYKALRVTVKEYFTRLREQLNGVEEKKHEYLWIYIRLRLTYKRDLLKYHRYLPIRDNMSAYRYGYPLFVRFYKRLFK